MSIRSCLASSTPPDEGTLFSLARAPGDMNRLLLAGVVLTVLSLLGYVVGVLEPYPGRAFSVTGVMVGVTLLALGGRT
jgi:hypothetical protein